MTSKTFMQLSLRFFFAIISIIGFNESYAQNATYVGEINPSISSENNEIIDFDNQVVLSRNQTGFNLTDITKKELGKLSIVTHIEKNVLPGEDNDRHVYYNHLLGIKFISYGSFYLIVDYQNKTLATYSTGGNSYSSVQYNNSYYHHELSYSTSTITKCNRFFTKNREIVLEYHIPSNPKKLLYVKINSKGEVVKMSSKIKEELLPMNHYSMQEYKDFNKGASASIDILSAFHNSGVTARVQNVKIKKENCQDVSLEFENINIASIVRNFTLNNTENSIPNNYCVSSGLISLDKKYLLVRLKSNNVYSRSDDRLFVYSLPDTPIDTTKKNITDIIGELNYKNSISSEHHYVITELSEGSYGGVITISEKLPENLAKNKIGCPVVITNRSKTKLYAANYKGDINIFDLASGRTEKSFNFFDYCGLRLELRYMSSIITNMFILDDEKHLIIQVHNFSMNGNDDPYKNLYVLDITAEKYISHLTRPLYSSDLLKNINEHDILNNTPKTREYAALQLIDSLANQNPFGSLTKFKIVKKYDGYYFTLDNKIPLKFISLANEDQIKSFNNFTNPTKTYLLSEIFTINTNNFALFGTAYGSPYDARLIPIDDLIKNHDKLLGSAKKEIDSFFLANIINSHKVITPIKLDKIFIKFEDGNFYFVSSFFEQNGELSKGKNVWGNSYKWYYHNEIEEIKQLQLANPILFHSPMSMNFYVTGFDSTKFEIASYHLSLNPSSIESEIISAEKLLLNTSEIRRLALNDILPINRDSEILLENIPRKIAGEHMCELCFGSGYTPDKRYNGKILSYVKDPITGSPIKCVICGGSGKTTIISPEVTRKNIVKYENWKLTNVRILADNVYYLFETTKSIYETRITEGKITQNTLIASEKLHYYIAINKEGYIIDKQAIDFSLSQNSNIYVPIIKY